MSSNVLYITYDGLLEPLGQSQVLRYLEKLSDSYTIYLISFEKAKDWQNVLERQRIQKKVHSHQIHWIPLKYHKSPSALATTYDLFQGITVALFIAVTRRIKIVHARSYVPSVIALVLKKLLRTKFIFDMRGFWADERVDGGIWPANSQLYHLAKWFEKQFLLNADHTVSLTEAAIDIIQNFKYIKGRSISISCIRTCTDLELFNTKERIKNNKEGYLTIGYIGSVTGWYLFEETIKFFEIINIIKPHSRFYILNKGEHDFIRQKLAFSNINTENLILEESSPQEISRKMSVINFCVFFIKPVFSKIASCPTKLGELLASGIPCVTNDGVGDMTQIIEQEKVGVILRSFDESAMRKAAEEILELLQDEHLSQRCRAAAIKYFSLEEGVKSYQNIWQQLGGQ
ncbi:hypothetical protein QYC27_03945 [Thermosynechococcus sp. PP45]|uniref:glycosyltransferase n=1 Tax=unclassified Thermosynechococcus TaxID=2622553 RepID=UPI002671134B|nr:MULTISPECIES: glycosyltransferase [unclassified Thermosynechococcus]WKT81958.1 hypothetical protein QYC27_03945 [Thermosynechococcus sp. PP45]WNC25571.1 hypothetical protein RHH26_03940 [Thermosynechococcus sp. PP551]WNC28150.1 hypothetical protein RHH27_03940 [Thermosynechococcus sp. PP555]WNC61110.1 hypothetical protein RHJ80_03950 [Thermosynechococcus sp. QS41]